LRLRDIKNEEMFWKMADNRYQRAHKLRVVWQNPDETSDRREKAFKLWQIMLKKNMILMRIITKINTTYHNKFPKGGISYLEDKRI